MLLYSEKSSPRLSYVTAFIGQELFKEDLKITNDKQTFADYAGPKINYSHSAISDIEFRIVNTELLFENFIESRPVTGFRNKTYKALFQNHSGDFPFDIFAASFYLLSRYEEYLEHEKDIYGRYSHLNSLAYKEDFLQLPLINIWVKDLKSALQEKFAGLHFDQNTFSFLPTYDIDIAYSYLHKGGLRNAGGFVRSAVTGHWRGVAERATVLLRKRNDPFDSYQWLDRLHTSSNPNALYFFLMAQKNSRYDKNIPPSSLAMEQLIQQHAGIYKIGIHPSWQSGDDEEKLETEIHLLEKLSGLEITDSRQHYLRFTIPGTYRRLLKAGIRNEYSMGYGRLNGFRASTASPFFWYDLENEEATSLRIHPFCFMDSNAYYHQKLTPGQAFDELISCYETIRAIGGTMITICHNNLLGTDRAFKGWKEAYAKFIQTVLQTPL